MPPRETGAAPVRTWRLDAGGAAPSTLVLAARGDALPEAVHWGAPLPAGADLAALARAQAIDLTGGMLDANPDLSLSPEASRSFPGHPGLIVADADGAPLLPRFAYAGEEAEEGLTLRYACGATGLALTLRLHADAATGVLTLHTVLDAQAPVRLRWLAAPVLPGPQQGAEIVDFAGRWCGEMRPVRTPWASARSTAASSLPA